MLTHTGVLPHGTRIRLQKSGPLVTQGQRDFLASRAPHIDINRYWEATGLGFEHDNLHNTSLLPHLNRFLDILGDRNRTVFEAGCGIGRTYDSLLQRGFTNYLGIDICQNSINEASRRHPEADFVHANLLSYDPCRVFDSVIATDLLLYFSPMDQVRALLKLQGAVDRSEGYDNDIAKPVLLRWAAGNNHFDYKSKKVSGLRVEGWVHLIDEQYLRQILYVAGFSPVYIKKEDTMLPDGRVIPYHVAIVESLREA